MDSQQRIAPVADHRADAEKDVGRQITQGLRRIEQLGVRLEGQFGAVSTAVQLHLEERVGAGKIKGRLFADFSTRA